MTRQNNLSLSLPPSAFRLQPSSFLPSLKKLVTELSEDLLTRSALPEIDCGLRQAYAQIEKGGRTADAFEVWREDYLDQVAVAWVLGCVFVRFMEDNHLIDECWLAGDGERRKLAEDTHELYFREHPHDSDREYFEHVFHAVGKIPAARDLFAEGKTPLWAVGPSGDMAMKLLAFWREVVPETGKLKRSFEVENGDTRFLGDLYQDLSERARKKYALLQTPVFVEEFILDRTLDPAIAEFGLDEVRMIDPTCGSGHFLLGGFARLFDLWIKRESNEVAAAQKALDGVWGCDINPFAVAIARFRLIVAALCACGIKRLKGAPAWKVHLATGDSLLFGSRWDREGNKKAEQQFLGTNEESWAPEIYACEDKEAIAEVLGQQYHAVVGNPPYIIVRDRSLNQAYRERYATCSGKYSLAVPFVERFFELAISQHGTSSGFVGQITANSFMKREFGKKLIEDFFGKVNLTHVIDTSGAYIPGHGTPTVILFGRNCPPISQTVRAVLGIKGEPTTPEDPSNGLVWQSIIQHVDRTHSQDAFTSVADVNRSTFTSHPWSIGGGGAAGLLDVITTGCSTHLGDLGDIGIGVVTLEDDAYQLSFRDAMRRCIPNDFLIGFVVGDTIRDWTMNGVEQAIFPHDKQTFLPTIDRLVLKQLWPLRTGLSNRIWFRKTQIQRGLEWFEYGHISKEKFRTPLSIAFAFVATHNHFVLDRGGKVFKQSAPIIKLPPDATEDDHLALLGLLNSSTACFWMKQVFFPKGGDHVGTEGARVRRTQWDERYEFAGTQLLNFPVPIPKPHKLTFRLDQSARVLGDFSPDRVVSTWDGSRDLAEILRIAREQTMNKRAEMIYLQEEIDWRCYECFGLLDDSENVNEIADEPLELGERAFEIVMARRLASGELESTWFERHNSKPITELPSHWQASYRELVEKRLRQIETNPQVSLIESPEYKRRWNTEPWEEQQQRALKSWLLDRLETTQYWPDPNQHEPRLQSVAEIADKASGDHDFLQVAAIYRGREDFDVASLVAELVEAESVPFLPVLRYKPTGLRKREVWEQTWELQRQEDALKAEGGRMKDEKDDLHPSALSPQPSAFIPHPFPTPVPPKYTSADFLKTDFWRLRGKLDVPKERWISYPHCETESDPSLLVGWAGWNHLQQATALIAYYDARKREGWDANRLTPLLAGLDQLIPWIHQWHPEVDPEFGETAGQSYETLLKADAHELGLTLEQIRAWEPVKKGGRRKAEGGSKPRKARMTRKKSSEDIEPSEESE
jgi:hypothetical protein